MMMGIVMTIDDHAYDATKTPFDNRKLLGNQRTERDKDKGEFYRRVDWIRVQRTKDRQKVSEANHFSAEMSQ